MNRANTELRKFREDHIFKWSQSCKSQTQYCKEQNLALGSFGYWKRKITKNDEGIKLVEIKDAATHHPVSFVELISPDGIIIRFREDISPGSLNNIFSVLRG